MARIKFFLFAIPALLFLNTTVALAKIPNIIEHTTGDVRYTFGYWPALVLGGGAITAGILTIKDHSVQGDFTSRHFGKADDVAKFIAKPYVLDPTALLLFGAGELSKNKKLSLTGETLLESLLFTDVMTGILKLGFNRTDPNGGRYSFPSSHTSSTFAIATTLQTLYGFKAGVPCYIAATFVGLTRLDMNEHFLADVVFGAALGSAIGWGTAHFHKLKNPKFFVVPTVAQGRGLSLAGKF